MALIRCGDALVIPRLEAVSIAAETSLVPHGPGTAITLDRERCKLERARCCMTSPSFRSLCREVSRLRDDGRADVKTLSDRASRVIIRFGFIESPDLPTEGQLTL
jgi:hypothetical protein